LLGDERRPEIHGDVADRRLLVDRTLGIDERDGRLDVDPHVLGHSFRVEQVEYGLRVREDIVGVGAQERGRRAAEDAAPTGDEDAHCHTVQRP